MESIKLFTVAGLNMEQANQVAEEIKSEYKTEEEKRIAQEVFDKFTKKLIMQVDTSKHLLTRENPNRFVSRPIVHEDLWEMYKKEVACFWTLEDIDFERDPKDWEKLTQDEKDFILQILAFFASSDGIVIENLTTRLRQVAQIPEARSFFDFQVGMESIHGNVYGELIDRLVPDEKDKAILFNAAQHFPAIKKKEQWAINWMQSNNDLAELIVAFAAVEGIFFSGAFASIFWIKNRGFLPGLTSSNEFISRDEGLHRDFACMLLKKGFVDTPSRERILEIVTEAVRIEQEFLTVSLPVKLVGMNCKLMSQYIEFVADKLLVEMGLEKHYNVTNPFPFMDNISLENKTNFFEKRVAEYQRAQVMASINKIKKDQQTQETGSPLPILTAPPPVSSSSSEQEDVEDASGTTSVMTIFSSTIVSIGCVLYYYCYNYF
uniref:ribonucleoside-diphosphate reductase n=1 Tax=White spot syndrome virus TaxID=92652 RepID=A0A2U9GFV6_WSSV|nr:wsv188 [Shrimp white spot syndrome virus]